VGDVVRLHDRLKWFSPERDIEPTVVGVEAGERTRARPAAADAAAGRAVQNNLLNP